MKGKFAECDCVLVAGVPEIPIKRKTMAPNVEIGIDINRTAQAPSGERGTNLDLAGQVHS